jgi:hypothetical protein
MVRMLAGVGGHHRRVLTAAGPQEFVAATGDRRGRWRVELHRGGRQPTLLPVDGPPTWQESPDGRVALLTVAVTADPTTPPPPAAADQPPAHGPSARRSSSRPPCLHSEDR